MARMGDWRDNKDVEIPLDGIGGVNILVKADVHRSGTSAFLEPISLYHLLTVLLPQASTSPATPSRTKPKPRALRKWPSAPDTASMVFQTMLYGILTQRRSRAMRNNNTFDCIVFNRFSSGERNGEAVQSVSWH